MAQNHKKYYTPSQRKPYFLILGMGQTGQSFARFLQAHPLLIFDSRNKETLKKPFQSISKNATLYLETLPQALLAQVQTIFISPGFDLEHPICQYAKKHDIPMLSDSDVWVHHNDTPILAITGTNGKTTSCNLLAALLESAGKKTQVMGNNGIQMLDHITNTNLDYAVMELSSFQLERSGHFHAHCATILNISPDHLDVHPNFQAYQQAKYHIFKNCPHPVLPSNLDHTAIPNAHIVSQQTKPQEQSVCMIKQKIYYGLEPLIDTSQLSPSLSFAHQIHNLLLILTMLKVIGIQADGFKSTLEKFAAPAHRLETIKHEPVHWINDSKATNIPATIAALKSLSPKSIILLLGGVGKGQDFKTLAQFLDHNRLKKIIIFGQDQSYLYQTLQAHQPLKCDTLEQAVVMANQAAQNKDIVLLSPACASFDQFKDFQHRGECFRQLVGTLSD